MTWSDNLDIFDEGRICTNLYLDTLNDNSCELLHLWRVSRSSWYDAQPKGHEILLRHLVSSAKKYIKQRKYNTTSVILVMKSKGPKILPFRISQGTGIQENTTISIQYTHWLDLTWEKIFEPFSNRTNDVHLPQFRIWYTVELSVI